MDVGNRNALGLVFVDELPSTTTLSPTFAQTPSPTAHPSIAPTPAQTAKPTIAPTPSLTAKPSVAPTPSLTAKPSVAPTPSRTAKASAKPTGSPSVSPSVALLGSISGNVKADLTNNNVGDENLVGAPIKLLVVASDGSTSEGATTVTDSDGNYVFYDLPLDITYVVMETNLPTSFPLDVSNVDGNMITVTLVGGNKTGNCRDAAITKVNGIIRRLCKVEANMGHALRELASVVEALGEDAKRDLRALLVRMNDTVALQRNNVGVVLNCGHEE